LVIMAHPEPESFSAALKNGAVRVLKSLGYDVVVSDLYSEKFNPVAGRNDFLTVADSSYFNYQQEQAKASQEKGFSPEITREQERVKDADLFVFVYPLWWGGMPAIMKGWFDRVMANGFAYVDGRRFDSGLFKGKHAVIALTTGGTRERFSDDGVYGPIEGVLFAHKRTMLEYLGLTVLQNFVAYASPRVSMKEREEYLVDWERHLTGEVKKISTSNASAGSYTHQDEHFILPQ
jgi:NAD(P)H dehydrogenase (quinone)